MIVRNWNDHDLCTSCNECNTFRAAKHVIKIGNRTTWLCNQHARELADKLTKRLVQPQVVCVVCGREFAPSDPINRACSLRCVEISRQHTKPPKNSARSNHERAN